MKGEKKMKGDKRQAFTVSFSLSHALSPHQNKTQNLGVYPPPCLSSLHAFHCRCENHILWNESSVARGFRYPIVGSFLPSFPDLLRAARAMEASLAQAMA